MNFTRPNWLYPKLPNVNTRHKGLESYQNNYVHQIHVLQCSTERLWDPFRSKVYKDLEKESKFSWFLFSSSNALFFTAYTSDESNVSKASAVDVCWLMINNYWMRLSMISWIIKTEVCVICRNRSLRQITQTRGFDNSWYHAKTEFNNCFIIHFSHKSSSETKAKRSAILFLRRTLQGA